MKSNHQKRVEEFMTKVGQSVPTVLTIPDEATRRLRAKLILEEALETINALGFFVEEQLDAHGNRNGELELELSGDAPDLEKIIDGCADLTVVTTGCAIACGVVMESVLEEVDAANLRKFAPPKCPKCNMDMLSDGETWACGWEGCPDIRYPISFGGHRRSDGKWVKGTSFTPPNILRVLENQGWVK